jgi:putative restriction endonuclease
MSCLLALEVLCAQYGDDVPYKPTIRNGVSLWSIHHRAFDENLIRITPDYETRVAPRLLEDEDGPMLDLLKTFDRKTITVPRSAQARPDKERLAMRFDRFVELSS